MTDERAEHLGTDEQHEATTGVAVVDDALARLEELETRPVEEHPAVFEALHGSLRAVLGGDGD